MGLVYAIQGKVPPGLRPRVDNSAFTEYERVYTSKRPLRRLVVGDRVALPEPVRTRDLQSPPTLYWNNPPRKKTAGGVRDLDPLNLITNRVVIQFWFAVCPQKENGGPPSRTDLTHCLL